MNPLLLHSVSYAGLWGQSFLDVGDFIAKAAELGFQGVMLMAKRPHLSVLDYGPKERTHVRQLLEKHKLQHVVLAGYNNLTADLEHGEVPQREMQTLYITELARLAAGIGAKSVRIFTGYEHPAADFTRQWRLIIDTLTECARRAADFGVTLGVQNHHDIGVGYESFRDLIRAVNQPNCRAMFDAWAPALQGEDLAAAAAALGAGAIHTTIADYQLRPRYKYDAALVNYTRHTPNVVAVPMGEGFIDYRKFLASLTQAGFNGSIAYEMCSPLIDGGDDKTLERYARRFLEYMAG
jgi:sugar phosphate isomerase/epimerase